jgi:hypothetical protein
VLRTWTFTESKSELCYDLRSVGQSVSVSSTHLGLRSRFLLLSDSCGFVDVGNPLWREGGFVVYNCCWPSSSQSSSDQSHAGLMTIFYCLRFETPPTYPPGTGWSSRLLRLAGPRIRPHRNYCFEQLLYCCMLICCLAMTGLLDDVGACLLSNNGWFLLLNYSVVIMCSIYDT